MEMLERDWEKREEMSLSNSSLDFLNEGGERVGEGRKEEEPDRERGKETPFKLPSTLPLPLPLPPSPTTACPKYVLLTRVIEEDSIEEEGDGDGDDGDDDDESRAEKETVR